MAENENQMLTYTSKKGALAESLDSEKESGMLTYRSLKGALTCP